MNSSIWNIWFIFGVIFISVGVLALLNQIILYFRCTEKTEGMIVRGVFLDKEAALMLTFTTKGQEYRLPFGHSNEMSEGDTVTVFYSPDKISRYSCYILEDVTNFRKMAIICIIGGLVSMLAGYGLFVGWFTETRYF